MSSPKVTLYWLSNSRAQRILWLLEEMEIPYALEKFYRDPATLLAPPELKALHPLGASPFIKVEDADGSSFTLAESGSIVQFLTECFADGKFCLKVSDGTKVYAEYLSWLHWAEGTAVSPAITAIMLAYESHFCATESREVVQAAGDAFKSAFLMPRLFHYLEFLESSLAGKQFIAGENFTGADVMVMFPVEILEYVAGFADYPNLAAWVARMRARPGFIRAEAAGDRLDPSAWI